jgi:hypothetical protein
MLVAVPVLLAGCAPDDQTVLRHMIGDKVTKIGTTLEEQVNASGFQNAVDSITRLPALVQARIWDGPGDSFANPESNSIYEPKATATSAQLSAVVYKSINTKVGWTLKDLRFYSCVSFRATTTSRLKITDAACPADIQITDNDLFERVRVADMGIGD